MTPEQFVSKWKQALADPKATGSMERSYSQEQFVDLCKLLNHPTPGDSDPSTFRFEKPLTKITKSKGFADIWKKDFFGWEYKGPHKDLNEAYVQLKTYSDALQNPPLLVVSDMLRFEVHTNFTSSVKETYNFDLEDVTEPEVIGILKALFESPFSLRPAKTRAMVTQEAADRFSELAASLSERNPGHDTEIAHFLNRIIFCMFAEDIGLLPDHCFTKSLEAAKQEPEQFENFCQSLFGSMMSGGNFGYTKIEWFNGGLFDSDDVFQFTVGELKGLLEAARLDWSNIEPAIFGTLFERGLDPSKRSQLGAHYTDPDIIMRLVKPVIIDALEDKWEQTKSALIPLVEKWHDAKIEGGAATKAKKGAESIAQKFFEYLKSYRVLDPACGSGNFLYLSLKSLKDFEKKVRAEISMMGMQTGVLFETGPENCLGIEINPYATELARVSVWIGELQWMIQNGYNYRRNPVLRQLGQIQCANALIDAEGAETEWPEVDAIVGNPPFVGDRKMVAELGEYETKRLRKVFSGRVPAGADLVTYWFEKARNQVETNNSCRVGLVATNSIRFGKSRFVLDAITNTGSIYLAWSDLPWVNEGAAVRVSLICFSGEEAGVRYLDDEVVPAIASDLSTGVDLTKARRLERNKSTAFIGIQKSGAFDISGNLAREMLLTPNAHPLQNSDVLRPYINGRGITCRWPDKWIIDFGVDMPQSKAAEYEAPYEYLVQNVKKKLEAKLKYNQEKGRPTKDIESQLATWWRHWRPRPETRQAIAGLKRYLVTPRVSKHRVFMWVDSSFLPDSAVVSIATDSDSMFGILQSRFHEIWTLRMCSWLGVGNDPRYTPSTTFETFPFPQGMYPLGSSNDEKYPELAQVAKELHKLIDRWLNPPEWIEFKSEVVSGFPDRKVVKTGFEDQVKKRRLTSLFNQGPKWLVNKMEELNVEAAKAYGISWPASDDEILEMLYESNTSEI